MSHTVSYYEQPSALIRLGTVAGLHSRGPTRADSATPLARPVSALHSFTVQR